MTAPTLGGNSLGNVSNISVTKSANLVPLSYAGQDSDQTSLFDMFGVTRTITITGSITGSSYSAVKTIVDAIEALISGSQTTTTSLVTDEIGTVSVMVNTFDYTWNIPSNNASYTITLLEGTTI